MTEDQKDEIATLVHEAYRLWMIYQAHTMMNTPSNPVEAEQAFAALKIAEIEWKEAERRLHIAQSRIIGPDYPADLMPKKPQFP